MQRHTHFITTCLLGLLLLVAACAHYPLNMSEAEWNRLNPEQQLEARKQQATIDQERAELRAQERREEEARRAEQERLQYEHDVAEGMIRQYSTACIGGSRCPDGNNKSHIFSLQQFAFVDKIMFTAHDNIGNKHGATIAIYADQQLIADNMDIKRQGHTHTVFVGAVARNIIVKIRNDDEVQIENFKVFGELLDSGNTRFLIQPRHNQPNLNQ